MTSITEQLIKSAKEQKLEIFEHIVRSVGENITAKISPRDINYPTCTVVFAKRVDHRKYDGDKHYLNVREGGGWRFEVFKATEKKSGKDAYIVIIKKSGPTEFKHPVKDRRNGNNSRKGSRMK